MTNAIYKPVQFGIRLPQLFILFQDCFFIAKQFPFRLVIEFGKQDHRVDAYDGIHHHVEEKEDFRMKGREGSGREEAELENIQRHKQNG